MRLGNIHIALLLLLALLLAACGSDPDATRTPIPQQPTRGPVLILTPSIIPVAPLEEGHGVGASGVGSQGVSSATQAGLPAEGQPDQDLPTVTPQPTQASFPMRISAADGLLLEASYYSAARRPTPGVLLLHMGDADRHTWDDLAARLQQVGYAVLAVDLRGHGATGGRENWALAQQDTAAALAELAALPGVDASRLIVIGAGIGANLGINACADVAGCAAAALLSPGVDYLGITATGAVTRFGARPLLIIASENDGNNPADSVTLDALAVGPHQLLIVPFSAHGTDLLRVQPDLIEQIAGWLAVTVPPPTLES